jgi:hypothetical protein
METRTCTEQHFLLAAKYFGPFQNSAKVMLMAQVYYHDGYKIGVSSGFSMLQVNFRNTRDLEEIAHCAVSVQFADSVCKQAMTNVLINTQYIFQSIFITSCI